MKQADTDNKYNEKCGSIKIPTKLNEQGNTTLN